MIAILRISINLRCGYFSLIVHTGAFILRISACILRISASTSENFNLRKYYHKKMAEGFAYGRTLLANDVTKIPQIFKKSKLSNKTKAALYYRGGDGL